MLRVLVVVTLLAGLVLPAVAAPNTPGSLISSSPMPGAPEGAEAWRILYWSTGARGEPLQVSGVIIAPNTPGQGRPVITWAHGTSGVVENCAQSQLPGFYKQAAGLADAVKAGYVYVATDYPGLGTPGPHPYLVGASEAHAVLDAVRAAAQLPDAGAGRRFAVWGESQGGHAALFTGEQAAQYAPDLQLVGVAAAAPPTDLVANLTGGTDPSIRAFLTAFTTYSWSRYYNIDMRTIGRPATEHLIDRLSQMCVVPGAQPGLLTELGIFWLRQMLKGVDLGQIQPWSQIAHENSAGGAPAGAPLLIAQTREDPIVAPAVTRAFARSACRRNELVHWIDLAGGDHERTAINSATETLSWIADRFAGKPAPSDCDHI